MRTSGWDSDMRLPSETRGGTRQGLVDVQSDVRVSLAL